jgi:hypothetical protein
MMKKMESTMMNSILLKNWKPTYGDFGITLAALTNSDNNWTLHDPYFFLKRELDITSVDWRAAKVAGKIRHCKIYRGRFLDYVAHKEFNTLEEWAKDAGGTLDDIMYGVNRIHKYSWNHDMTTREWISSPQRPKYVELNVLLKALGYVPPPRVEIPATKSQDLSVMINLEMRMHGLTIDNVWIIQNNAPVRWADFMSK